jgi:hypothetical protein
VVHVFEEPSVPSSVEKPDRSGHPPGGTTRYGGMHIQREPGNYFCSGSSPLVWLRDMHSEDLLNLYDSPNVVRVIKPRRMK